MAWYGASAGFFLDSLWFCVGYWALFAFLFVISIYFVALDLRYIRLQYTVEKRELFRQTIGNEEFRRDLIDSQEGCTKQGEDT